MSQKGLTIGSACPELSPGKLRIYSMRFCPYAKRSLIVLAAKNIPHEIVNINLLAKPEWFFEKNPFGKVPALEFDNEFDDGMILVESLIICDYLDEAYPNPRLHPEDPYERARDRVLVEVFNKLLDKMLPLNKGIADKNAWHNVSKELIFWEVVLKRRKTAFFSGPTNPGMLDYMIWPWFERMDPMSKVYSLNALPDKDVHPHFNKWVEKMKEDATIKKLALPVDMVMQYLQCKVDGTTDYDVGL